MKLLSPIPFASRLSLPSLFILLGCLHPVSAQPSVAGTLEPQFDKGKSFTQIYTLTALVSDSSMLQIQFVLTNLGLTDRNGACKIVLVSRAGKPLVWNRKYGAGEWRYIARSDTQSLTIGANRILVHDGGTTAVAGDNKITAEVRFQRKPDLMSPPGAHISAKGRFFEYAVGIRWMPALVTLKHGESPVEKLHGYAMFEISRSTSYPADICRGWLTFRGYGVNAAFTANIRLPPEGSAQATGWVWKGEDLAPAPIQNLLLELDARNGIRSKPTLRKVAATDASFTIVPQEFLCRYSFIDELGPVLGAVVKLVVGAPVVYFYRAHAQVPGSTTAVPGILEYMSIE